jgi:membrane-bound lytic murein transglycosylase D
LPADSAYYYFAQAEELYAQAVQANQESDWNSAQEKFEKSLSILYLMPVDESDSAQVDRFNRLLREIAYEYKNTLIFLGELSDDTSQLIFLEQFYDLQTFKNQDFAVSSDLTELEYPEEMPEIEEDEGLGIKKPDQVILHDMPVEWNWRVRKQLDYLTATTKGRFQEYLYRSGKYIDLMREIIKEKGLPEDLVYLPLIESGFNPKAYSWAHASGPWQFIASTGKKYGLNRNWWYDERRDFVKSTYAACDYLKYLYSLFGDWKLALAAYNGGEGRVGRSIKRQKTKDFWELDLRKQTEDYVPRYMAAVMVAKEPEKYGFSSNTYAPVQFEEVEIKHCLDLKEVAKRLETDIYELRELNPELLRDVTPPGLNSYFLRIPDGKKELFWSHYQDLSSQGVTVFAQHKVKRGETLGKIAQKYRTTVSAIAELNNMSARKTLRAGQYLTVPVTAGGSGKSTYSYSSPGSSVSKNGNYFVYKVRRNDNLHELAKRYGTTIGAIRKLNGFSSRRALYAGEKIKIPGSGGYASKNTIDRLTENLVIHIVREGDTLWKIARSYRTSLSNLLAWNQLTEADNIRPGQRLKIYKY